MICWRQNNFPYVESHRFRIPRCKYSMCGFFNFSPSSGTCLRFRVTNTQKQRRPFCQKNGNFSYLETFRPCQLRNFPDNHSFSTMIWLRVYSHISTLELSVVLWSIICEKVTLWKQVFRQNLKRFITFNSKHGTLSNFFCKNGHFSSFSIEKLTNCRSFIQNMENFDFFASKFDTFSFSDSISDILANFWLQSWIAANF